MNIHNPDPITTPVVVRNVAELRAQVANWRSTGLTVGLVPTMGALHDGHLSLIRRMRAETDKVIVSLFVNPTQFGPNEDFKIYPRDEDNDLAKIAATGGDMAYVPEIAEIYPDGAVSDTSAGPLGDVLCGKSRPGHFDGVVSVVARLFRQCTPDAAIFGEKDYQQLLILRNMAATLELEIRIIGAPIVREADGMALSSRNRYLNAEDRTTAAALSATLRDLAARAKSDESNDADLRALEGEGRERLLAAGFESVSYLEFRDGRTLDTVKQVGPETRIFGAAVIADVRLIDNMPVAG